nr:BolA family protein [Paraferrimonas sp. SM1919]
MQQIITTKLQQGLSIAHLEVINESHMHASSADGNSHFKVIVVSDDFEGKRLLARHRIINELLKDELKGTLHALAIHTYTKTQWQNMQGAPLSPPCAGKNK